MGIISHTLHKFSDIQLLYSQLYYNQNNNKVSIIKLLIESSKRHLNIKYKYSDGIIETEAMYIRNKYNEALSYIYYSQS